MAFSSTHSRQPDFIATFAARGNEKFPSGLIYKQTIHFYYAGYITESAYNASFTNS